MAMDVVIRQWVRNKDLEQKNYLPASSAEPAVQSLPRLEVPRLEVPGIDVPGIDNKKGVEHFEGDWDIYWDVVRSFAQNTPPLLDKIRGEASFSAEGSPGDLNDYAIIVHGIKSSSRSIGAEALGKAAEDLEYAAKAGNVDFIRENHRGFIQEADQVLTGLKAGINRISAEHPKPRKTEPAAEILADLLEASRAFDIDGVDRAMRELESCEYETGEDLVVWLREKADTMGFKEIADRLAVRTVDLIDDADGYFKGVKYADTV
jgi:HPt (histidine-containing phosphotransfer) domain-containing protein